MRCSCSTSAEALRLRAALAEPRIVRGGRVLKWKGRAASCAPIAGLFVRALAPAAVLATGFAINPAAAQLHWDGGTTNGGNPAADANGGAGAWNNTLTNWDDAATGGASVLWNAGDATFGGSTGGVVTVDAVDVNSIFFARSGYTLNGGAITLTGASPSIGVSFADGATINSVLAGTNGLTTTANGILALGGNNTLTGGITVADGRLRLDGANSANGANNVVRVNAGASLQVNNADAFGGDTEASRLLLDDGSALVITTGAALFTHDVTIVSGAALISGGTGNWTGDVFLSGATSVQFQGTLTVGGNLFDNGGVLSIDTATRGGAITFTGNLSHTGGLTVGNATTLSGLKSYSGDTIVAGHGSGASMLTFSDAAAISANSNVVIGDADTVGLVQFGYSPADITLGAGGGQFRFAGDGGFLSRAVGGLDVAVTLNGGAGLTWGAGDFIGDGDTLYIGTDRFSGFSRELNFTNDIDLGSQQRTVFAHQGSIADHGVLSGDLSGAGGLQIVGDGLLELRGANTYTGATEVQSALMLGDAEAINGGIGFAGGQSNLQINGVSGNYQNDGIVVLTTASGDFLRGLGTGGDQVQWLSDGGFTAVGGDRTVNIGNGAALTWGAGGFVGDGDRLVFGGTYGDAAINFENNIDLGSANRTIEVNNITANALGLNLNGVISGSGDLILDGTGDVALTASNTFTGNAVLGSSGASDLEVTVSNIGVSGADGNLGAGDTIELRSPSGQLNYVGAGEITNRNWILGLGNGQHSYINSSGTGALELTGDITSEPTSPNSALHLRGSYTGATNVISGLISDGPGTTLHIAIDGAADSAWRLTGENTYSGRTQVHTNRVLEVGELADGGTASNIGDSLSDADNLHVFGTLRYIGAGDSTDRLMQVGGETVIESSGTGAVQFTNTGLLVRGGGNGHYRVVLGGTNTGENIYAPTLTNLQPALQHSSHSFGITKDGPGLWALTTDNNAHANAYTNNTIVSGGALRLGHAGAITGGLGVASNHGATGSPERSSMVLFDSTSGTGGALGLTDASGAFTRGLTTEADAFIDDNGTAHMQDDDNFVQGVRWSGSGGFAAWDGVQIVNLFGDGRVLTWNTGGFVPTNRNLVFSYQTADGTVDFQNDVNLTNAARTIEVSNGTAAVDAIMSGAVSSTTAAGALVKTGLGALSLTGANTYAGETQISAGTLFVNGNQAGATGLMTVAGGATLGGAGVIGGNVDVAAGATLAPGNSPGTLTINGDLILDSGSILDFEFGQANTPGGPLNDHVDVGGSLTLDGVINVTVSPGGAFGPGVYRVFSYDGVLTNNTLDLGAMPAGSDVFVQTSVDNQVNLVNTAGLTLNFWDGPSAGKNDADIHGGSGVWRLPDGANEWTDMDGLANVDYEQNSFAVFLGAAGTVTVDHVNGAVGASGMQFAADGYVIDGDALTLAGASAEIRVGDGSSGSANYVATIDTELTGGAALVKTGAGTLALTQVNTYTSGTAMNGGVLRISSDASLGDAAGGLSFNGGALQTTADITSARDLAFIGAGGLIADPATALTLDGALSGAGDLVVSGDGMVVLNGASTRTGATTLAAGSLFVEGDQSGASGLTTVLSGAALGGTGVIGGDVAISGGALAPGFNAPGTLTIAGDLSFSGASALEFELGEADTVGGALNDLIDVGGDLTLDGVINVSAPAGGAFGPGIYRIINYGGALINNGLALGAGTSADVFVQTSIEGRVNLVNIEGLTLNFWDGAAGGRNDDSITGGAGVWQNAAGNDNWTDVGGALNAPYQAGGFTVFAGTGDVVTVDASLGAIMSAGMQFAADGYAVTGDAIELLPPIARIQVGDGSGAVYTATVDSALTGGADLIKTGNGVLILGGANSYTGDTAIQGGVVQISSDANLGAAGGSVILDGGALRTTASFESARNVVFAQDAAIETAADTMLTLSGPLSGGGVFTKSGEGALMLTGDNSGFAGATIIGSGALTVNGSLCGDVNVLASGRLQGTGTVCTTNNAGVVAPGYSIGMLTVAGDYTGDGGTLEIEAVLGGDASPADLFMVSGDTFGTTTLRVINLNGGGGHTVEGIKVVDVGGASGGVFTLTGDYAFQGDPAVIGGAYAYRLYQNGVSTPGDGDWYLRSMLTEGDVGPDGPVDPVDPPAPLYQPGAPLYEAYPQTLAALNATPTFKQRVGDRRWKDGVWGRAEGALLRARPKTSTSRTEYDADLWRLEAGVDAALHENEAGALVGGLVANYGRSFADVSSIFGVGQIETTAYGVGATLTWHGANGFYADLQGRTNWYDSDIESGTLGWTLDNDGSGQTASVEIGRRVGIGGGFAVTPQMQYVYSNVDFDTFEDPFGAVVERNRGESFRGRFGLALDHHSAWTGAGGVEHDVRGYAIANLHYEFLDEMRVRVTGTEFASGEEPLWGSLGLGGEYTWNRRVSFYGEASAETTLNGFGDSRRLTARVGLRAAF